MRGVGSKSGAGQPQPEGKAFLYPLWWLTPGSKHTTVLDAARSRGGEGEKWGSQPGEARNELGYGDEGEAKKGARRAKGERIWSSFNGLPCKSLHEEKTCKEGRKRRETTRHSGDDAQVDDD